MDEIRRFLRYVIPGLIFITELLVFIFLSYNGNDEYKDFVSVIFNKDGMLPFAISTIALSGGIGALLATIYHAIYDKFDAIAIDHRCVLENAVSIKIVVLKLMPDKDIDVKRLSRQGAWRLLHAYWHERVHSNKMMKSIDSRFHVLTNVMHGLGSALIGTPIAFLIWSLIHYRLSCVYPGTLSMIVPFIIFVFQICNYISTVKNVEGTINIAIWDSFKQSPHQPLTLYVMEGDLD